MGGIVGVGSPVTVVVGVGVGPKVGVLIGVGVGKFVLLPLTLTPTVLPAPLTSICPLKKPSCTGAKVTVKICGCPGPT